jgi:hypothetical protein
MILRSDRGSQFTGAALCVRFVKHEAVRSMSGTGKCYDNARMEAGFSSRREYAVVIVYALVALIVLLVVFFQWIIVDAITPFLAPLLWGLVICTIIILLVVSIVYLVRKRGNIKSAVPLLITITLLLMLIFTPFTKLYLAYDYSIQKDKRAQVIHMIESGDISYKSGELVLLPEEYRSTSKGGGNIYIYISKSVTHLEVLFYTFVGVLDNYSGYLYLSDRDCQNISVEYTTLEQLGPNWYMLYSH